MLKFFAKHVYCCIYCLLLLDNFKNHPQVYLKGPKKLNLLKPLDLLKNW